MAILLFSDFGAGRLYSGQVEAVLDRYAPGVRVIDLMNDAPAFDVKAAAHLLAAVAPRVPRGHVFLGVVDPGVGSSRAAVVMRADGHWFVGPDNGLFSVVAARAATKTFWRISAEPAGVSVSFHARDLFAPLAAAVATDDFPNEQVETLHALAVQLGGEDVAEVIYVDAYGNTFTGLRAAGLPSARKLEVGGRSVPHARVFADVPAGTAFWYENSVGLVEIAVSGGHAARELGLTVGQPVSWLDE